MCDLSTPNNKILSHAKKKVFNLKYSGYERLVDIIFKHQNENEATCVNRFRSNDFSTGRAQTEHSSKT